MEQQQIGQRKQDDSHITYKKKRRPSDAKRLLELFATETATAPASDVETRVHLVPRLYMQEEYRQLSKWLEFRIGAEKLYVIRNLRDFLQQARSGDIVEFGKNLTIDTRHMVFVDEVSKKLWAMLTRSEKAERDLMQ